MNIHEQRAMASIDEYAAVANSDRPFTPEEREEIMGSLQLVRDFMKQSSATYGVISTAAIAIGAMSLGYLLGHLIRCNA